MNKIELMQGILPQGTAKKYIQVIDDPELEMKARMKQDYRSQRMQRIRGGWLRPGLG